MRFSCETFLQKEPSLEINYELVSEIPIIYMWLKKEKIEKFEICFDLQSDATMIDINLLNPMLLEPQNQLHIKKKTATILVNRVNTNISYGNITVPLTLYTLPKVILSMFSPNCLSLTHKYLNESYSFIHSLRRNKVINNLSFSFVPGKYSKDGLNKIIFGQISQEILNKKHALHLYVGKEDIDWTLQLDYFLLIFSKETGLSPMLYNNATMAASIQSNEKNIIAPPSFIFSLNKFLSHNYGKLKCLFVNQIVQCRCSTYRKLFDSINFVIQGAIFKLSPESMFEKDEYPFNFVETDYCNLKITRNNEEKWIIGTVFLKKYISVFDYDKNKISFYSNEEFQLFSNFKEKKITIFIFILNICLILIGIATILINIRNLNQKKK